MSRKKKGPNSPSHDNPLGGYVEFAHDHLASRMDLLRSVLLRRATRKDLSTVHIVVKPDGTATIAATDMEISLQLKLDVLRHTGTGRVMIDANALTALLGAYSEPWVRIHLDSVAEIRVEGMQTKLKLPGCDPEKEMKLTAPGSLTGSGWMVRADQLVSAIRRTIITTDDGTSTRYALGGLCLLFPKGDGTIMEVVATDGKGLSVVRLPVRAHGENPTRTWKPDTKAQQPNDGVPVLVNKAVGALMRLAKAAGDTSIGLAILPGGHKDLKRTTWEPGRIQVVTRDAVLTAKCPEGRFPQFRDVMPTGDIVAEFNLKFADKLGALLATAAAGTDSESVGVDLTMVNGVIMLETSSETKGKGQLSLVNVEMTGRGTVAVDAYRLRQFFDVIKDNPVRFRYYGSASPLVLNSGPDHDFILMPITRDAPAKPAPKPAEPEKPKDDGGSVEAQPETPEPLVPVGVTPDAHEGNGEATTEPPPPPEPKGRRKPK